MCDKKGVNIFIITFFIFSATAVILVLIGGISAAVKYEVVNATVANYDVYKKSCQSLGCDDGICKYSGYIDLIYLVNETNYIKQYHVTCGDNITAIIDELKTIFPKYSTIIIYYKESSPLTISLYNNRISAKSSVILVRVGFVLFALSFPTAIAVYIAYYSSP